MELSDYLIEQYKCAAGEGCALELRLRLLAAMIPELEPYCIESKFGEIELKITEYLGGKLSDKEKETLRLCRQLRNKILHSDFRAARGKLTELGAQIAPSGTISTSVAGLNGEQLLERILSISGGDPAHAEPVTSLPSENIFGWLLELASSGDFARAVEVFGKGSAIVNRLTDQLNAQE